MVSGYISDRIGPRISLIAIFILWVICLVAGALVKSLSLYWLVGSLVGIALGSTWVVSRAFAIQLVSSGKIGEVFGLFNLVGYISSIAGALFWGLILLVLSPLGEIGYRIALLSLNLFFVLGLVFILRIPKAMSRTL
jgi:UMF1 family MFS transporter